VPINMKDHHLWVDTGDNHRNQSRLGSRMRGAMED